MLGLLIPLAIVGAMVRRAVLNAEHPPKRDRERERLRRLKAQPVGLLTLDELEDGVVLARRYRDPVGVAVFAKNLTVKRRLRAPI